MSGPTVRRSRCVESKVAVAWMGRLRGIDDEVDVGGGEFATDEAD